MDQAALECIQAEPYDVTVVDAYGTVVFSTTTSLTSTPYSGDPLEDEMYYQLRVLARGTQGPISASEDLRGVFIYRPE
jgi:hypothetical protein